MIISWSSFDQMVKTKLTHGGKGLPFPTLNVTGFLVTKNNYIDASNLLGIFWQQICEGFLLVKIFKNLVTNKGNSCSEQKQESNIISLSKTDYMNQITSLCSIIYHISIQIIIIM